MSAGRKLRKKGKKIYFLPPKGAQIFFSVGWVMKPGKGGFLKTCLGRGHNPDPLLAQVWGGGGNGGGGKPNEKDGKIDSCRSCPPPPPPFSFLAHITRCRIGGQKDWCVASVP